MSNLAALLEKEASAEIEEILSEARDTASEIVAKAKEEAKSLLAQKERALKSQHDAEIVRAKSSAQLEAASQRLEARNEGVEAVFGEVKDKLLALTKTDKYAAVFDSLFNEAASAVGKVETIIVNPADSKYVNDSSVKVETDDNIIAGLKLKGEGSSVMVENSLLSRLESVKEDAAALVSKTLFGDETEN